MEPEEKIIKWLVDDQELFFRARTIAQGDSVEPDGEIFEYGDDSLAEWIHEVLFGGYYGEMVFEMYEIDARHLNFGRDTLTSDQVLDADWEKIRKALLREK